ncbi:MAG: DUF1552 domain-containing protein [Nannocystaceae bacterium]|nr:DUF1552 domain-containing protein [bacterium]
MKTKRLHRRTLLTGLGGAAVALPFLEAMLPRRAFAAGNAPCRFVSFFAGVEQRACVPSGTGASYTQAPGWSTVPAAARPVPTIEDIREHVLIVTGTEVAGTGPSGVTPPGGKSNPHHGNVMAPMLTGFNSEVSPHGVAGSTADQLHADVWGADTQFRSLQFRVQPIGYRQGTGGRSGTIAYDDGQPLVPQTSPSLAYESLFAGFVPPDASADDLEAHEKLIARKLSVLDLVKERADALIPQLGGYDRQRVERHFDQIRDFETRLSAAPPATGSGACEQLPEPPADPSAENFPNTQHGGSAGYSDEDLRGHLMVELVHMALACDLTRAASVMLTQEQSMMSLAPLFGANYEMHDVTHNDIPNRAQVWDEITTWHAGFFAKLVQMLADTPEPTGGTMLDTTGVILTNSGGPSAHGCSNLSLLVAGVPSVLRSGEHVAVSGHPCQIHQTVLHALGVEHDMGDLPGLQPAMLV